MGKNSSEALLSASQEIIPAGEDLLPSGHRKRGACIRLYPWVLPLSMGLFLQRLEHSFPAYLCATTRCSSRSAAGADSRGAPFGMEFPKDRALDR